MFEKPSPSILLVDDDSLNLDVLACILAPHGYGVRRALSGELALEAAQAERPDLVLLDVRMPGMDGYETCRALKADDALRDVPVLMISGLAEARDRVKGFQAGSVDYISKPFNAEELLARVQTHLALRGAQQELSEKNEEYEALLHILLHDLMNPIGAMRGFLRIVRSMAGEESRKFCDYIGDCIHHQEQIIDQVRELRALETGKKSLSIQPVNLQKVVNTSSTIFANRLEQKQIRLVMAVDGDPEDFLVLAEQVSLTHNVLNNLISNAIKFSYRNSEVNVRIHHDGEWVHLEVEDRGIGIPQPLLETLFRTDRATSHPGTENERGTGFGMPLVQKAVQRFGGSIEVESRTESDHPDAHGTLVRVRLHRAPPA